VLLRLVLTLTAKDVEIAALRKMVAKMKVEEAKYTVSRYLQYLCITTSLLRTIFKFSWARVRIC
jgi:hypothetical protein